MNVLFSIIVENGDSHHYEQKMSQPPRVGDTVSLDGWDEVTGGDGEFAVVDDVVWSPFRRGDWVVNVVLKQIEVAG